MFIIKDDQGYIIRCCIPDMEAAREVRYDLKEENERMVYQAEEQGISFPYRTYSIEEVKECPLGDSHN